MKDLFILTNRLQYVVCVFLRREKIFINALSLISKRKITKRNLLALNQLEINIGFREAYAELR